MQKIKFTLKDNTTHANKVNENGTNKADLDDADIPKRVFAEDLNGIATQFNALLDALVANGYATKNGDDYTLKDHPTHTHSTTQNGGPAK